VKHPISRAVAVLLGIAVSVSIGCADPVQDAKPPGQPEEPPAEDEFASRPQAISEDETAAIAALRRLGASVDQDPDGAWHVLIEDIEGTKDVDNSWLVHLTALKNLKTLKLWSTAITDAGLATIGQLDDLEQLRLYDCSKVSGAGLKHLRGLVNLESLDIEKTSVDGDGLKHLRGLARLRSLNLLGTSLEDNGLVHLEGLKQLKSLRLDCTRITDAGLVHLKPLSQLEFLHLEAPLLPYEPGRDHLYAPSKIGDAGLARLAGLPRLRVLNLEHTNVTDAGIEHLSRLTGLEILVLNRENLSREGLERLQKRLPQCGIHDSMIDDDGNLIPGSFYY
jgi:hypothetical protein